MEKLLKLLKIGLTPKEIERKAKLSNGSIKRILRNKTMRNSSKEKIENLWEKSIEIMVTKFEFEKDENKEIKK